MIKNKFPRILISAASSGSGKTTFTCALLYYLKRHGFNINAFKCGPDYIDPMFHRVISGVECINIDPFFLNADSDAVCSLISRYSAGSDITVIEGVMGLYDGKNAQCDYSTYSVARMTKSPVVVVVNAKGTSLTALAMAEGIAGFGDEGIVKGIIFNNMGDVVYNQVLGEYNERYTNNGRKCDFEIIGHIRTMPKELMMESRHLGLITPDNTDGIKDRLARMYEHMKDSIDWAKLVRIAESAQEYEDIVSLSGNKIHNAENNAASGSDKPVIAVAKDDAFNFYYKENLRALERAGAVIEYFSPLADEAVPKRASGLYIGGGYPESYTEKLSRNENTKESIRNAVASHMPVVAECGGFMYLTDSIDGAGMCGIIKADSTYTGHLVRFGYTTLTAKSDNVIMKAGQSVRAHEFHYYDTTDNGADYVAVNLKGISYDCVTANEWMYAGFPHIYFPSCEGLAERFIDKCRNYCCEKICKQELFL